MSEPTQTPGQEAIYRAMSRANPDEEGSLMRELMRECPDVGRQVQQVANAVPSRRHSGRSCYVPGWRAP